MPISKSDAIKQLNASSTSNQYSLVKKLAGPQINKQLVHTIPGGQHLTELVSKESLVDAVFVWLRRCRHFKDVLISMTSDYTLHNHTSSLVVDFNTANRMPEWEIQGKKWLAERISEILSMDNILAVKVEKEGISAILDKDNSFDDKSDSWNPHLVFTPHKPTGF